MSEWLKDIKERFVKYQTDYNLNSEDVEYLINRIEELEIQLSINTNNTKHLQNKIKRYKQALEFYAKRDNYQWEVSYRPQQEIDCMVIDDSGHTARKALEDEE